jgi:hypothetical protein
MRPAFRSSRCLPPEKDPARSLSRAHGERCLAGRREQLPRVFIDVREHRLDLSSSRFRVGERGRARSSGFCRSIFPRARPGTARTPSPLNLRWGRLPDSGPGFPGRGNHRMGTRSGAEENRSSTLPVTIARPGDFAPTSTVFRCLLSRPSLPHPVWSDVGREGGRHRNANLQGSRTTGRCHAALPRRSSTLTCPRHLPSQGRSRTNEGSFAARRTEQQ